MANMASTEIQIMQKIADVKMAKIRGAMSEENADHAIDAMIYMLKEHQQMAASATQAGIGVQKSTKNDWWGKLCFRMDWNIVGAAVRHPHIAIIEMGESVFLFTVTENEEPIILKDAKSIFPSDTTIGQLRVLGYGAES